MLCRPKTLYANGTVVTMDANNTRAEAVLVAGGRIEAVGGEEDLRALGGPRLSRVDLHNAVLFPGFIDTHSHLSMYAAWKSHAYCGGLPNVPAALDTLAAHAARCPEAPVAVGYGFDDTAVPEQRGPSREELDAICRDRPLLLLHISVHAGYANSRMLQAIGIAPDAASSDPDVICAHGAPTGLITERVFFSALEALPALAPQDFKEALRAAVADYNAQGFTATLGGGAGLGGLSPFAIYRALAELERENRLNIHVRMPILRAWFAQVAQAGLLDGVGSPLLRPAGVKILMDGSIQAFTAALSGGYRGHPEIRPGILGSREDLDAFVLEMHTAGHQVVAHGNGDEAIEAILAAVEHAQAACPRTDPRHLLIHCQTATDAQLARMKNVGLWPSFFGLHVWNWGDRHRDIFLGPERAARIDPCGSAARLGLPFSLHADTPVLPQMTMLSMHTAVNRLTSSGRPLGPEQRISPLEAVRAYTTYAAAMCFDEARRGSIEPGKIADFTLLGADPCAVPPEDIRHIPILATISAGRPVWGELTAAGRR